MVVLQEIFGVNAHIRAVADRFAARGYLAVAPATFARVQPGVDLGYGSEDMAAGRALKAAAEALGNTPTVAKSSYIDPRVFTRYRRGQVLDVTVSPESAIRTLLLG